MKTMTDTLAMKTPNIHTVVSKSQFSLKKDLESEMWPIPDWDKKKNVQDESEGSSCVKKQGNYQRSIGFWQKDTGTSLRGLPQTKDGIIWPSKRIMSTTDWNT